jgi:hypothetical protein
VRPKPKLVAVGNQLLVPDAECPAVEHEPQGVPPAWQDSQHFCLIVFWQDVDSVGESVIYFLLALRAEDKIDLDILDKLNRDLPRFDRVVWGQCMSYCVMLTQGMLEDRRFFLLSR